jgi:hypothetical protein
MRVLAVKTCGARLRGNAQIGSTRRGRSATRCAACSGNERRQEASDLLEIVLQGGKCGLRARKISGLQRLRELAERLIDRTRLRIRSGFLRAFRAVMVVMMPVCLRRILLRILLHVRVVALRRLQVPGLQVLPELIEGLHDRIRRVLRLRQAGETLRERCAVLLRLRQVSGLQVLA